MPLPFVGPSAALATRKADVQRSVNMHLVGMETPGKAPFFLQGIPGLVLRYSLGGAVRGGIAVSDRAFVVAGSTLYEVFADFTSLSRGTLQSSTAPVDMAYGLSQLVVVDGSNGYVLTTSTNAFARITADGFYGSTRVSFINNRFIFTRPDSQQYEWSAIDDAASVDALDFASAEAQPDNIVAHLVLQDQIMFLGELSTEFHFQTTSADLPFERAGGESFSVGCAAVHSAQLIDNGAYWLGKDRNGSGIVYMLDGRRPKRISTQGVEQAIQASTDISGARAFCFQRNGLTFYCLNVPGVQLTWCYEVASGAWHNWADLDVNGQFTAHRATSHLYAFGRHLVGTDDGHLYEMDSDTFTNAGDPLVRERTSPHEAAPGRMYQFFKRFFLDATTGDTPQGEDPQVEYSYSKDSGATWSNALVKPLGKVGERQPRIFWPRLGIRSRDLVHRVRFSGNARFDIIDAGADVEAGDELMFPNGTKQNMLNGQPYDYLSLHTDFPGSIGANEMTGGSPPYQRGPALTAIVGAQRVLSASVSMSLPAATVKWIGFWYLGSFVGCAPNGGATPKNFVAYDDLIHCPSHGYAADQTVVLFDGTPPGGTTEGATYSVLNPTTNTFQIAETAGGTPITLTSPSSFGCVVSAITEEVYPVQGLHRVDSAVFAIPD